MITERDIYASANLLIQVHGSNAEIYAYEQMLKRSGQNFEGGLIWFSVLQAIEELRAVEGGYVPIQ